MCKENAVLVLRTLRPFYSCKCYRNDDAPKDSIFLLILLCKYFFWRCSSFVSDQTYPSKRNFSYFFFSKDFRTNDIRSGLCKYEKKKKKNVRWDGYKICQKITSSQLDFTSLSRRKICRPIPWRVYFYGMLFPDVFSSHLFLSRIQLNLLQLSM